MRNILENRSFIKRNRIVLLGILAILVIWIVGNFIDYHILKSPDESFWEFFIDVVSRVEFRIRALYAIVLLVYAVLLQYYVNKKMDAIFEKSRLAREIGYIEQRYTSVIESMYEGVVLIDSYGEIVVANSTAQKILGLNLDDSKKNKINKIIEPELRELFLRLTKKPLDSVHQTEIKLTRNDKIWDLHISASPVLDRDSTQNGIIVVLRDISNIKDYQRKLEHSERKFRNLSANHPEVFFIYDNKKQNFVFINKNNFLGHTVDIDSIRRILFSTVHNEDFLKLSNYFNTVFDGSSNNDLEVRFVNINGEYDWLQVKTIPFETEDEVINQYLISTTVVTERIKFKNELNRSETRYYDLISDMNEALVRLDAKKNITYINNKFMDIMGYSLGEVIGKSILNFIHESEHEKINNQFHKRAEKNSDSYETKFIKKDGSIAYCIVSPRGFYDIHDNLIGSLGVITDITSLRRTELKLERNYNYEKMISSISAMFLYMSNKELEKNIEKALKVIGTTYNVDRCYIFMFEPFSRKLTCTNQWYNEETLIENSTIRDYLVNFEQLSWLDKAMHAGITLSMDSIIDIPENALNEKKFIEENNIQSLMLDPLIYSDDLIGIIGLESNINQHKWTQEDKNYFKIISNVFTNVIVHNHTEQMLLDAEHKLRLFSENMHEVLWITKEYEPYTIYYQSSGYSRIWGTRPQPVDSLMSLDFSSVYPNDMEKVKLAYDSFLAGEGEFDIEYRIIRKDGNIRWISDRGYPVFDEIGKLKQVTGIVTDITERKLVEAEVMKFKTLADYANYGIMQLDIDGTITYCNKYLAELHEATIDDVIGVNIDKILTAVGVNNDKIIVSTLKKQEDFTSLEVQSFSRDGKIIHLLVSGVNILDDDGNSFLWGITAMDISEIKNARAEKEELTRKLAEKNTELEQIIYMASHDLRSPLVNVMGYGAELRLSIGEVKTKLQDLEMDVEFRRKLMKLFDEDINESIRYITTSAEKIDSFLTGLLRISRLGRAALAIEKLDMNEMIRRIVDSNNYQILENQISVSIDDIPPCYGDNIQINQVFSNLLENAIKYLDPSRNGKIKIYHDSQNSQNGYINYIVEDNGIGIDDRYYDRIFEVFNQLDPQCQGQGLGLTIVKRIVNRHTGDIFVESKLGKGSKFHVYLPSKER